MPEFKAQVRCFRLQVRQLVVILLVSLFTKALAAQDTSTYRLSWVRGPSASDCPNAAALALGVRARLGRDPFGPDAERDIEGSVSRTGDTWHARLNVLDASGSVLGSRELTVEAPDCASVADAVMLAIALTIDPEAASAPVVEEPANLAPVPAPAPSPAVMPAILPKAPEVAPASSSVGAPPLRRGPAAGPRPDALGLAGSLEANVVSGALPRPALGAALVGDLILTRRAQVTLAIGWLPEVSTAKREFLLGLAAGGVGLCLEAVRSARLRFDACGEFQAGAIHVVVREPQPLEPGERVWLAPGLGPRLRGRLAGPLQLVLRGSAHFPLRRYQFAIQDVPEPVFEVKPVVLSLAVGLGVSIP